MAEHLSVNDDTGCAMLDADPQDPKTLYAAMWQFRRKPWTFTSGGPGSGLFKTTDGGKTWAKLAKGLPEGDLGRIGVRVAPSNPKTVYAVVEAKKSALFRSDDAGATWAELNSGPNIVGRPFYFANLYVDPKDEKRVYKPGTSLSISDDAGKTFSQIAGSVHSDFHAMWIEPRNLNDAATVGAVLHESGFDPALLLALANAQEVKDLLKAQTENAVARGVFGAPTMFVGNHMFWGQDRLDFVREALGA